MALEELEENYDQNALLYAQFLSTPLGTLEAQLFSLCITQLHGQRVLDLGGGTGLRAREALAAGVASVDVIDISTSMMAQGQAHEARLGRSAIRWLHGDASKSLAHLDLQPYDLVIANGIFDHARSVAELEAMWANTAKYCKPRGKVIANRNNPRAVSAGSGKYGVELGGFRELPEGSGGGVEFTYRMLTPTPLEFESVALDGYAGGDLSVPGKFFEKFENVEWEECPVVKADKEFWKEYLEDPILYIFTATRNGEAS